jgi:class 3 adenylate cyclase
MPSIDEGTVAAEPLFGTALLVDLRNFSAQLDAAASGAALREFGGRLGQFYALCRSAAEAATRGDAVHLASTGDGMLAVFHGPQHVRQATVCALLLRLSIARIFPMAADVSGNAAASFGVGLESGELCRVLAGGRATYIGRCINLAARLETMTKTLDSADCVLGEGLVSELYRIATGQDFAAMSRAAMDPRSDDREHLRQVAEFGRANHALCLNFLHYHRLRGMDRPVALHGISKRAGVPGNPRFEALLDLLAPERAARQALGEWLARHAA